jgi:hypothetical protein
VISGAQISRSVVAHGGGGKSAGPYIRDRALGRIFTSTKLEVRRAADAGRARSGVGSNGRRSARFTLGRPKRAGGGGVQRPEVGGISGGIPWRPENGKLSETDGYPRSAGATLASTPPSLPRLSCPGPVRPRTPATKPETLIAVVAPAAGIPLGLPKNRWVERLLQDSKVNWWNSLSGIKASN